MSAAKTPRKGVGLPDGTRRRGGLVLSTNKRAKQAASRDARRAAMYAEMDAHPESAEELLAKASKANERASVVNNIPGLLEAEAIARKTKKKDRSKRDTAALVPVKHMAVDYFLGDAVEKKRIREINKALSSAGEAGLAGLKLGSSPIAILLNRHKIGGEEFMAAQEMESAFMAISGALMFKPLAMERTGSSGKQATFPDRTSKAVARYQAWADHWSRRSKRGDKTLEICISAIIDMRPFSVIEADIGMRHGKAQAVTVRALRDYAARAGWTEGGVTRRWKDDAEKSFPIMPTELAFAAARARALAESE